MCTAVTFSHWLGWCNIQYGRLEGATSQFPFWPNHLPETSTTNLTKHQTDDHASTCKPTKLFIYHDFLGEFFNALFSARWWESDSCLFEESAIWSNFPDWHCLSKRNNIFMRCKTPFGGLNWKLIAETAIKLHVKPLHQAFFEILLVQGFWRNLHISM